MNSMPLARIHAPNSISVDTVERPEAGPDDVLIRVERCGICGSDLSYAKLGGIPGTVTPFALGHEFAGVVEAVGENVIAFSPGERVVVNPMGGSNAIGNNGETGAFAPYVVYRDAVHHPEGLLRLPEQLDYDLGALVEPLSVGMHAANQSRLVAGDTVVVMGAGPVGLAAAIAARYQGAAKVTVVDLSDTRLSIAASMGLETFNPAAGDLRTFLMDVHGSVNTDPMLGDQPATDVFIEATGVGAVFQQICDVARSKARITVVAVHFAPVALNMLNLLMKELIITAAYQYPSEFPQVMEMLVSGQVDVRPMISHHFPLSSFTEAFAQAQRQGEALKVLIDCQN